MNVQCDLSFIVHVDILIKDQTTVQHIHNHQMCCMKNTEISM